MDKIVKSFAQQVQEHYGYTDFDGDLYVVELQKSLGLGAQSIFTTAGGAAPNYGTSYADGTALKLQNMDSTLTSVLFQENHFVFFNWLNKVPSLQPLYEWNRRRSYGSSRSAPGFREGTGPKAGVGSYERNNAIVRFMGVRRGLTQQINLTGQLGGTNVDPVHEENRNGALELLEKIERQLVFGDSLITDQSGATVNYDGLLKQMASSRPQNIIDLQGQPLYFENFEDIAFRLFQEGFVKNFSNVQALMTGSVMSDLSKLRYANQRQNVESAIPAEGYKTGFPVQGHATDFGYIPFEPSVFLEEVPQSTPLTIAETGAPAGPTGNGGSSSPATGTFYVTAAADPNAVATTVVPVGGYYIWVAAYNESGEGAAIAWGQTGVNTGAATKVNVTSTNNTLQISLGSTAGYGDTVPVGYRIYRSTSATPFQSFGTNNVVTDPTCGLIAHVPQPSSTLGSGYYLNGTTSGAGSTNYEMQTTSSVVTWIDRNQTVPRSGMCLVMEKSEENMVIAQMSPLIKWPLAISSTTVEWFLLLYHTFAVKAPERQFVFKNIGRLV